MTTSGRKAKVWTEHEDKVLKGLKEASESHSWAEISFRFIEATGVARTAKQCRDRYFNYLSDNKSNSVWQDLEIEHVFRCFLKFGTKWSVISKVIQSKNECQIKNLFYATIRRNIRKFNKGKLENEKITLKSVSILENTEIREILTASKKVGKKFFLNKFLSKSALEVIHRQGMEGGSEGTHVEFGDSEETWEDENFESGSVCDDLLFKLDEIEPILFY